MKIKTSELKIGDVLYPFSIKISDEEVPSCAVVVDKMKVFNSRLEPVDVFMADISFEKEDGTFATVQRKLTDNEEYNVVFRKRDES